MSYTRAKMFSTIVISLIMFATGFYTSSSADVVVVTDNIHEQKAMILERENEELRVANEQWYKALEAEQERRKVYMLCVGALSAILVSNAVVNYIGILFYR